MPAILDPASNGKPSWSIVILGELIGISGSNGPSVSESNGVPQHTRIMRGLHKHNHESAGAKVLVALFFTAAVQHLFERKSTSAPVMTDRVLCRLFGSEGQK